MTNYGPVISRYCVECGEETLFEQPPCPDAHAECPDWACAVCGSAYVVGWLELDGPSREGAAARSRGAA